MSPILDIIHGVEDYFDRRHFLDEFRREPMLPSVPPGQDPYRYEQPIARSRTLDRVGAWAGSAMLRQPYAYAAKAKQLRIDEIHLMVADHSAWRDARKFDAQGDGRPAAGIRDLRHVAGACAGNDIDLSLTTWVMPNPKYIDGLAGYLHEVVEVLSVGLEDIEIERPVRSIILDAEEPWTKSHGAGARAWVDMADRLGQLLEPLKAPPYNVTIGLTGIGYAREAALDPLAEFCDFAVPQVYCTTRNELDPHLSPARFARRWTELFESKQMQIGLAAYRQPKGGMTAAIEAVRVLAEDEYTTEVDGVIYWSLANILASKAKREFVAGIKGA